MSKIDFLKEQIIEARTFVNRLMSELPEDLWYVIPEGTDSNFIWQVGHLLVSQNFHTLTAVTGVNEKVGRLVPIQKYNTLNPQLHSRSATYIKRNGLLIRKITIKSSRPFQCAYHPLTP